MYKYLLVYEGCSWCCCCTSDLFPVLFSAPSLIVFCCLFIVIHYHYMFVSFAAECVFLQPGFLRSITLVIELLLLFPCSSLWPDSQIEGRLKLHDCECVFARLRSSTPSPRCVGGEYNKLNSTHPHMKADTMKTDWNCEFIFSILLRLKHLFKHSMIVLS